MIPATQMKIGMVIRFKNNFHRVVSLSRQALGRGSGKVVAKLKNLNTGANIENRFRSVEQVEPIRIETRELEYLYESGNVYTFMRTDDFEQIELSEELIEDIKLYLLPNAKYPIDFYDEKPIGIQPPRTMELKVIEADPNIKGATAASSLKPAKLETGLVVGIPGFVEIGETIKVDTTENKYIERVKN